MEKAGNRKILLILDIDETLMHASDKELHRDFDFKIGPYFVYKRPGLNDFLYEVSNNFQLAIWSSASDNYVLEAVKHLIPIDIKLAFVWARTKCTYRSSLRNGAIEYRDHYNYIKPLKKLKRKGFDLNQILIVDDTPSKSQDNYGNAIYPSEYLGKKNDDELIYLAQYLSSIKDLTDVRKIEKRAWRSQTKIT